MLSGSCSGVFQCVLYLLFMAALLTGEERVLLMVNDGNNVKIESVWSQIGVSSPTDLDPLMSAGDLIPLPLVRSPLIDDWDNAPDKLHIRTLNDQGDILWEMVFDVAAGVGPALPSILVASNILSCSSPVTFSTVDISWSKSSYQLYIGSTIGTDTAWLGVWDGPLATPLTQYPVFLVPRSAAVPPTLTVESSINGVYTYEGCWSYIALAKVYVIEDVQAMTLQQCEVHCRALGHQRMLLEMGFKCHCGDFIFPPSTTSRDDTQCTLACNGNPGNSNTCGGNSNMFAVYPVTAEVSIQYQYEGCWDTANLDMQTYLDKPYMTVTLCNSVCSPRNKALSIIQGGQACLCGTFRSTPPSGREDSLCVTSCGGSSTFEPCGGNGRASVYLTDSGTINQELPSTVLPSTNVTTTVAYTTEILVNVSGMSGFAVSYVTSVRVTFTSNVQGQYELYYNSEDCKSIDRKPHTYGNSTTTMFSLSVDEALDTLPVYCMWIVFPTPVGPGPLAIQVSFLNDTTYILARYLAIVGEWDIETTTGDVTQTVTPVVTSEDTSEQVNTEVTSVVQDTTTPSSGQSMSPTSNIIPTTSDTTTNPAPTTTTITTVAATATTAAATTTIATTTTAATTATTTTATAATTAATTATAATTTPYGIPIVTATDVVCPCPTQQYVLQTEEEIRRRTQYLQDVLKVNKKTLSSYIRKRTSAVDNRRSAISLGGLGIIVIITSFSLVVFSDIANLRRYLRLRKQQAIIRDKTIK